jgi:peptidyl-dipeptidase Dcp
MMTSDNSLLAAWDTPYGMPPFDRVRPEHFAPAMDHAMAEHRRELDAIASDTNAPSFENTIVAFDAAGTLLERVALCFENLTASETSPDLQAVERELAPRLASHHASLYTHDALFARVDAVFAMRETLNLPAESRRLLERIHLDFELAGARLSGESKRRYVAIAEELATLTTEFEQNVLADEASWSLTLSEADCVGLPPFLLEALASVASQRKLAGASGQPGAPDAASGATRAVALSRSIVMPFLTTSPRRDLRETVWRAWTSRGEHEGAHDNKPLAKKILALRAEQARLRGHASYADAALVDRMAGKPEAVLELFEKVWEPAKSAASRDRALLLEIATKDGLDALAPWDWRYYAEKVRQERFDMKDAELKPYFALEDMIGAMTSCASKLFGVTFEEVRGVPLYHPDVRLWEVKKDGALVGLFLGDNFARPTKRGGAWMHNYRKQRAGTLPIVVNNNNFAKAPPGQPTPLSFDDVRTLFHEFGHGLHGLLSRARFKTLSGTEVLQDYVELPSQLFEHWAQDRGVLSAHARHVETREPIPAALLDKLERARRFDQAFATIQYVGSALLDMALHRRTDPEGVDITTFEREERARLGVPEDVGLMHRLPHFRHLFSSAAYAAGYYVYMWAEVLDADAFEAFKERGDVFDAATAKRLFDYVYSAGNTIEPREGYRAFRGRDARVEPMLKKRGLIEATS